MARYRYIEHITILTGSSRRSARSEVKDAVVADIIASLRTGPDLWDGWSVTMIKGTPDQCWAYDLKHHDRRIVSCWLCANRKESDRLWAALSDVPSLPGVIVHPPMSTPWLAATPSLDLNEGPPDMALLETISIAGDVERCVAWALLEGGDHDR